MLVDALVVFAEVAVWLVLTLAFLWLVTKFFGYIAMLFEGEKLVPEMKHEIDATRRQLGREMQRVRHA
jgi:hypothetical protein